MSGHAASSLAICHGGDQTCPDWPLQVECPTGTHPLDMPTAVDRVPDGHGGNREESA